jgi:hypothetical protein
MAQQAFRKSDPSRRGVASYSEGFSYMRMMRLCLPAMQHIRRDLFGVLRFDEKMMEQNKSVSNHFAARGGPRSP